MVLHPGPKGKGKCWECLRCQFPRRGCSTELATFCHAESKGPAKNTHVIARPKAVAIRFPFHAKHGPSPKGTEEERIATSAYGLLAMTRKIEPGPSIGGAETDTPGGVSLRDAHRLLHKVDLHQNFSKAPVQLCEATGCPLTNAVKGGTIGNRNAA